MKAEGEQRRVQTTHPTLKGSAMSAPDTSPRTSPLWFVAAPVTAIVARLMWTPLDDEEPGGYIAEVARNADLSATGALLMFASAILLIPAAFALASVLRDRKPRLARTATGMIVTGAVGMGAFSVLGIIAADIATHPDRTVMLSLWEEIMSNPHGGFLFLPILAGAIGFVVLAVGLFRSHAVPGAAAVLVGLGGAATLFTIGGPMRPLLVTAAALALAGFGWVAAVSRSAGGTHTPARRAERVAA
jgi:hypothetical protein